MISRFPLTVLILFAASVWALVLAGHGWAIPVSFFTPLSLVVGATSMLLLVFDRVAWRWPLVGHLAHRPDLRGTWAGTLQSDWKGPDGHAIGPIRVFLVVHQTFGDIHIRLLTPESASVSLNAVIEQAQDDRYAVTAIYRNEPKREVRHRTPIHHGGLRLSVVGVDGTGLQGEYWTDRHTSGSMDLSLLSRTKAPDYATATAMMA